MHRLKTICALYFLYGTSQQRLSMMTANDLTMLLPLLVQGRRQLSFVRDPLELRRGFEEDGGANNFKGGQFTSK